MILHRILINLRIFLAGRLRDQIAIFIIFISCFYMFPWSPVCLFCLGNELVGIIILIGIFLNVLAFGDFFICGPISCRIVLIAVCSCTFIFFLFGTFCSLSSCLILFLLYFPYIYPAITPPVFHHSLPKPEHKLL